MNPALTIMANALRVGEHLAGVEVVVLLEGRHAQLIAETVEQAWQEKVAAHKDVP